MYKNDVILFISFFLLSLFAQTFGVKKLIEKKKLIERDTKKKWEKSALLVIDLIFTSVCLAILVCFEKNILMLLIIAVIAILSGMIFLVDARVKIIPNVCLYPILLLAVIRYLLLKDYVGLGNSFIAMFVTCYGLLFVMKLLGLKGYFGSGDVKLLSVSVFLFGISQHIVGFVVGWVVSLFATISVLLLLKKITRKSMIAYGPYLAIGILTGLCSMYI